jgi:hypothetical protein
MTMPTDSKDSTTPLWIGWDLAWVDTVYPLGLLCAVLLERRKGEPMDSWPFGQIT